MNASVHMVIIASMACCVFGVDTLPGTTLNHCQLHKLGTNVSEIWLKTRSVSKSINFKAEAIMLHLQYLNVIVEYKSIRYMQMIKHLH